MSDKIKYNPSVPYNDLPLLPPKKEIESTIILKKTITASSALSELKGAIPRIIMGAIIAITISKPLEIRMFKTEIDLAVSKQQEKEKQQGIDQAKINFDRKNKAKRIGKVRKFINNIELFLLQ
jgi:hypothetical protein